MILDRALAGLRGAPGMRSPRMAQNVLNFMQFYWKIWQNCMLAPPPPPQGCQPTRNPGSLPPGQRARVQHIDNIYQQECIPVGCVPSAAVAVSGGVGVYLVPGGCTWPRGVCSRGVYLVPRGVPSPGVVPGPGGSAPRAVVYLVRYSPPPVDRHTPVKT